MSEWHVYLLECADGSLYCGIASNLERRLDQHNGKLPGGAKYTRARRPVKLLASRTCGSRSIAGCLEYRVKAVARDKKLALLQTFDVQHEKYGK